MVLTFEIRNTRTGALELPVEVESCTWRTQLDPGATITAVINGRDAVTPIPRATLHLLSEPLGEYTFAVREGDFFLAAGVITKAVADDDAGTLTIQCQDLDTVFWDNRLGASVRFIGLAGLVIEDRSASGFVRAVLLRAMDNLNPDFPRWHLPVDLPADGAGSLNLASSWWEFKKMGELLDFVRELGYHIYFRPYLHSSGALRWETTVAKTITGAVVPLSLGAAGSPLKGVTYDRDGQNVASGVLRVGNGEGVDTLTKFAAADEIGAPIRHVLNTDSKDVDNESMLQAAADADIELHGPAQVTWGMTVHASDEFPLASFQPGRSIYLDVRGHWVIPPGVHKLRVMALSGDALGLTATPEVVPYA